MTDAESTPEAEPSTETGIPDEFEGGHPATPIFDLLGRAHTMSILFFLVREDPRPWRFSELEKTLSVSPNTLSSRLDELVAECLLERESYDVIPPRVEYTATQKARDLVPVFRELRRWAESHGYETGLDGEGDSVGGAEGGADGGAGSGADGGAGSGADGGPAGGADDESEAVD